MNKRNTYYGALVEQKEGTLPPAVYGKKHGVDYDPDLKYVVLITDSIQNRKALQAIARENDCEVWMVQRAWLKKKEIDEGLRFDAPDCFRRDLEGGYIFPLVSKGVV